MSATIWDGVTRADAWAEAAAALISESTQLLVHLQVATPSSAEENARCSATLHQSGHWLSREAFERLSCDANFIVAKS